MRACYFILEFFNRIISRACFKERSFYHGNRKMVTLVSLEYPFDHPVRSYSDECLFFKQFINLGKSLAVLWFHCKQTGLVSSLPLILDLLLKCTIVVGYFATPIATNFSAIGMISDMWSSQRIKCLILTWKFFCLRYWIHEGRFFCRFLVIYLLLRLWIFIKFLLLQFPYKRNSRILRYVQMRW